MDFQHSTAGYFSKREGVISPDDKLLLLLSDKAVKVYNRESGQYIESITGHTKEVTSCIFHPEDGNFLITSSLDSRIGFWDFQHRSYTFIEVPGPIESRFFFSSLPLVCAFFSLGCFYKKDSCGLYSDDDLFIFMY
jgi:WD40 repeat protein